MPRAVDGKHALPPQFAPPSIDHRVMHNPNWHGLVDGQELPRGSYVRALVFRSAPHEVHAGIEPNRFRPAFSATLERSAYRCAPLTHLRLRIASRFHTATNPRPKRRGSRGHQCDVHPCPDVLAVTETLCRAHPDENQLERQREVRLQPMSPICGAHATRFAELSLVRHRATARLLLGSRSPDRGGHSA